MIRKSRNPRQKMQNKNPLTTPAESFEAQFPSTKLYALKKKKLYIKSKIPQYTYNILQ